MSTNGSNTMPAEKPSNANEQNSQDLSKDQVGWYFVEQYYNTVSKNPEKLHLFYGKKSQFVYGAEAQVTPISCGRGAIQDRIKRLDFQDCKVRISNVDTQSSYDNIVIQVIGEFSNKGETPKKFVQTFVLAQQPSGYFVLNDILRCIDDDEDEEEEQPQPIQATESKDEAIVSEPPKPAAETPAVEAQETPAAPAEAKTEEPAATEEEAPAALDTVVVDKKLEQVSEATQDDKSATTDSVPEAAEPAKEPAKEPEQSAATTETADPETTARQIAEEDAKEPEKPKDPSPTPVAAKTTTTAEPEKPATPAAAPAPAPAKPMTWARLASGGVTSPRPVVPLKSATPPAPAQSRPTPAAAPAAAPSKPAQPAQTPATASDSQSPEAQASGRKETDGWQTAGENSKRQNRPQSMVGPSGEKESTACYVKYVSDKVQQSDLESALSVHGNVTYCDINRTKNCAFVDFALIEESRAAIAGSPYTINGENIVVEPRRRTGGYQGGGYGNRGSSMSGRGRGFDGGRSGSQRGAYGSQGGRGGRGSGRGGRGNAQMGSS